MKKKLEREQERKDGVLKLEAKLEAIRKEREAKKEEIKDKKEASLATSIETQDRGLEERILESERVKKQLAERSLKEEQDRYITSLILLIIHIFDCSSRIIMLSCLLFVFQCYSLDVNAFSMCYLIRNFNNYHNREKNKIEREKSERDWKEKKKEEEEKERKRKEREEAERKLDKEREIVRLKELERKRKEKEDLERKLNEERSKDRQTQEVIAGMKEKGFKGMHSPLHNKAK